MIVEGSDRSGLPAGMRFAKTYDGLLSSMFGTLRAAMMSRGDWREASLAAVGSYGRGALALHSDLDVRIICERDPNAVVAIAESLLYPLWDAGLDMGHQVVTPDAMIDLAKQDLPTATSLLDWRLVAGDDRTSQRLLDRAHEGLFGAGGIREFLERLSQRALDREARFGGSVFLLEPDVKNGAGGLRDLDVAHWAARARWRSRDLAQLVAMGVLVPRELAEIEAAMKFLWRVRNLLHLRAKRRSDRLSFERQEDLAETLGYGTGGLAAERFMSDYYRHARAVSRYRDTLLSRAAPPPTRRPRELSIGRGLKLTRGAVSIGNPAQLDRDPALALRLVDEAVRRDVPIYEFARDVVRRASSREDFCSDLRNSAEAAQLFVRLCCVFRETELRRGSVLAELHDLGLLLAMIPEFAPVVGRVHHDVYHVYTVDEHSIAAVDRLRALSRGDLAAEFPVACRLAAEMARPHVVALATLLHDIGKVIGGRNHSERGAEMARDILERLRLPEVDIQEVQHLILKHLRMYHVATRRDVDDPETLTHFGNEVHGREGLRELYLLTVADVSTTSPTAMTSWKARMLDELFLATDRWLAEGEAERSDSARDAIFERVFELLGDDVDRRFANAFLHALPRRYVVANVSEDIASHARLASAGHGKPAHIEVINRDDPYVEICVVANDRPGLLALIAASLAASRVRVVGAQVYSWFAPEGEGRALDMFWIAGGSSAEDAIAMVPRVERDLSALVRGEAEASSLVPSAPPSRWGERPSPAVPTRVVIDNRASANHTVIEVLARDRIALLFWLAHTIERAGLTIALAKINTEGTRVADVFYVCDENGSKVSDSDRIEVLRRQLISAVDRVEGRTASSGTADSPAPWGR